MSTDSARAARSKAPFDARGLASLAKRAGAIALEKRPAERAPRKRAEKVLREIESWLSREAHGSQPRARIALAHETGPLPRAEWVLTVDAIDGVDAYLAGLPTWSVSLGLLRRGEPWSAVVYAPALGDLYVSSSGTLRWQGQVVEPSTQPTGFVLGTGLEKRSILRLRRRKEAEGPLSYHACLVARGAADGAVLGRINVREAAPLACLLAPVGGGFVSARSGKAIGLESLRGGRPSREPLLATLDGRGAELSARIRNSSG